MNPFGDDDYARGPAYLAEIERLRKENAALRSFKEAALLARRPTYYVLAAMLKREKWADLAG